MYEKSIIYCRFNSCFIDSDNDSFVPSPHSPRLQWLCTCRTSAAFRRQRRYTEYKKYGTNFGSRHLPTNQGKHRQAPKRANLFPKSYGGERYRKRADNIPSFAGGYVISHNRRKKISGLHQKVLAKNHRVLPTSYRP